MTSHILRHGTEVRGAALVPDSPFFEGRFGRMFRTLPRFRPSERSLRDLAGHMFEPRSRNVARFENPDMPAGYTYLGQFIDHDITFDPASSLQRRNDPDALVDFRTPRFDLDSMYGRGPADDPFMYDQSPGDQSLEGAAFLIGRNVGNGRDLPRNQQDRALIGDPRNDENLIVSQLHSTMLRFHNNVAAHIAGKTNLRGGDLFAEAHRQVRWMYQWVVVNDFLRRLAGDQVVDAIMPAGASSPQIIANLDFFQWQQAPFIPVEFSVAAYRFGHSMIRFDYQINDIIPIVPIFSDSTNPLVNLNGFRELPSDWGFDWRFFFQMGRGTPSRMQHAHRIDAKLAAPLERLPRTVAVNPRSLAERNLLRGRTFGLPSGQAVASQMGIPPLSDSELGITSVSSEFVGNSPLWFYVLKEAEKKRDGKRLGPVGARIVAEVLLGLLAGDPQSFLTVQPAWHPEAPFAKQGKFRMQELIGFALS